MQTIGLNAVRGDEMGDAAAEPAVAVDRPAAGPVVGQPPLEALAEGDVAGARSPSMLGRGAWALVDQAVFSATNWLMQVLLAAWLPSEAAYGTFVVAFTGFLLLGTIHNALLIEPMLVFGPDRHRARLRRYLGVLCVACVGIGALTSAALAVAGLGYGLAGSPEAAVDFWSMAVAAPCILLLWLTRRACYVRLDPRRAALAGIGYVVVMVAGMAALRAMDAFSVPTVMAVLAVGSLVTAAWLARAEGVVLPRSTRDSVVRAAATDHWRYGRWAMATGLVMYLSSEVYYFLLPGVAGFEASGALRAVFNLFLPLMLFTAALSGLLLPLLVRAKDPAQLRRVMLGSMLLLAGVPVIWWAVAGLFQDRLLGLLYPGRFTDVGGLVWLVGLQPVVYGWESVMHAYLRSREQVGRVFASSLTAGVLSLAVGIPLMFEYGLMGAAVAAIVGMGTNALISTVFVLRLVRRAGETG